MASGYITLLALDEQLRVTRSTLAAREDALKLAKRQYETGYSSRLELVQSETELRATRAQIPQLEHQITQQENALSILLGQNPGAIARGGEFDALSPLAIPSQLPSSLLNRRPDIVQAERTLVASDAQLNVARARCCRGSISLPPGRCRKTRYRNCSPTRCGSGAWARACWRRC